jgi:hypothetical protein
VRPPKKNAAADDPAAASWARYFFSLTLRAGFADGQYL